MSVGTGSLKRTQRIHRRRSRRSRLKLSGEVQQLRQPIEQQLQKQPRELQLQKRMLWQQMRKRSRHRESHASFRYIFYRRRDYLWQKKVWI